MVCLTHMTPHQIEDTRTLGTGERGPFGEGRLPLQRVERRIQTTNKTKVNGVDLKPLTLPIFDLRHGSHVVPRCQHSAFSIDQLDRLGLGNLPGICGGHHLEPHGRTPGSQRRSLSVRELGVSPPRRWGSTGLGRL